MYKNSIGRFMRAKIIENGSHSDSIKKQGFSREKGKPCLVILAFPLY